MEKTFDIPVHSIILMIGPVNSGKSHLCKNKLVHDLYKKSRPDKPTNIQNISLEDIQRGLGQLSDDTFHSHSKEMETVRPQALDILLHRVKIASSYPVNAEYIIVDVDGSDETLRSELKLIAKNNKYNMGVVILDYKNKEDYFKHIPEHEDDEGVKLYHTMIRTGVKVLRNLVIPSIKKNDFKFIHKIQTNDFKSLEFTSSNFKSFSSKVLNPNTEFLIIGDVHGCLDELKEIIEDDGFEIYKSGIIKERPGHQVLLLGDFVDKGPQIKETIEFVHKNCKRGTMLTLIGNHENFVVKFLRGEIKRDANITDDFLRTYMNTVFEIEDDEVSKKRLFEIVDNSGEFYIHKNFIATHAPCKEKYLGKVDSKSLRAQRMIGYPKRDDFDSDEAHVEGIEKFFGFLIDESSGDKPDHFFGHVQTSRMMTVNKFNLDNGCVSGGHLTSAKVYKDGSKVFWSLDSKQKKTKELNRFFK